MIGINLGLTMLAKLRAGSGPGPEPEPFLPLNDPSFIARALTISSQTESSMEYISNLSDTRRTATWATPPAGSRVRFTVTSSAGVYFRAGVDTGLGTGGYRDLVTPGLIPAGTTEIDIVLDVNPASYPRFGFLSATTPSTVQITNWHVTPPQ